jgi:hypothetical protein
MNFDYWTKTDNLIDKNIFWNIPEQKTGTLQVIGGNVNNFSTEIRQAEFLNSLPIREVRLLLPDVLRTKIPPIPGIFFAPSTESGSLDKSEELNVAANSADSILFSGDFSKNSKTSIALTNAIKHSTKPITLVRDAVDSIIESTDEIIEKENLTIVATMSQLQKIFRSLMYPKMILLSSPLMPIIETLHKFTLSYPATIATFHEGQIIIAKDGKVITTPIESTKHTPIELFIGSFASQVAALQIFVPKNPLLTAHSAIFWK